MSERPAELPNLTAGAETGPGQGVGLDAYYRKTRARARQALAGDAGGEADTTAVAPAWHAWALGAIAALVYWLTRSKWLDDWDSVQFAQALGGFDLFNHRPHPPGYPLYIFYGWVATHWLGFGAVRAWTLLSALGGGLFVGCWLVLARAALGTRAGWVLALSAACCLGTWLTSVKVMTDAPGAGLLALTLLLAWRAARPASGAPPLARALAWAALAGAATVAVRPQHVPTVLVILSSALIARRARPGLWAWTMAVFVLGNLLWLVPTLWTQSRLPRADGNWLTYPQQLLAQWRWRLDKPVVSVFAEGAGFEGLVGRLGRHTIKCWLLYGLGGLAGPAGKLALGAWGAGVAAWLWLRLRAGRAGARGVAMGETWMGETLAGESAFWRFHLPWAVVYWLVIFTCLPASMRYHMPVLPLLLAPAALGLTRVAERLVAWRRARAAAQPEQLELWPRRSGWWAWAIPAALPVLMLAAAAPLALESHDSTPPPVQLLKRAAKNHPRKERERVWLLLDGALRHGEWYGASGIRIISTNGSVGRQAEIQREAVAVYTDDADFLTESGWTGVKVEKLKRFRRNPLIHDKHARSTLYRVTANDAATTTPTTAPAGQAQPLALLEPALPGL